MFRCVGKFGNPPVSGTGDRRFKSDHADLVIAVVPVLVSGGRLLNAVSQVRFLPPQLVERRQESGDRRQRTIATVLTPVP